MKNIKSCVIALTFFVSLSVRAQVAVIANKSVPDNSIEIGKINEIYLLKTNRWGNGSTINPITLKSDNVTSQKFYGLIGRTFNEMKTLWMRSQLKGEGKAPEAVETEEEVINKVASTPGAIGFVEASKVNSKVKVLLTFQVN